MTVKLRTPLTISEKLTHLPGHVPEPPPGRSSERRTALILAAAAFVLVFILWQTDSNSIFLYPFRLLVTFVHEAGHGITAILTGGSFVKFGVEPNGAGEAFTAGGSIFLVKQMGYLGAALFGAVLLYAANHLRHPHWLAISLAVFFIACALLFAGGGIIAVIIIIAVALVLTTLYNRLKDGLSLRLSSSIALVILFAVWLFLPMAIRSTDGSGAGVFNIALLTGLINGVFLIALGTFAPRTIVVYALNVLAFTAGFNALNDVWILLQLPDDGMNDASALAHYTNTPVGVWVALWIGLTILMMAVSVYFTFLRSERHEATILV